MQFPLYVFDAYGTLFDVHSAAARHDEALGPQGDRLSEIWRTKQLEYTWVRTLCGRYRNFAEVTTEALDYAIAQVGGIPAGIRERLLADYDKLDAYPEVAEVLAALRANGARTAILSNGNPEMLTRTVEAAGLAALLDAVLSVDDVKHYKAAPTAYALAERSLGSKPSEISFQSSNRWDIAGATAFGFRTVWINRSGAPDEYDDLPPAQVVSDLRGLLG